MPKFAANLSLLFTEWPFEERFAQAAAAGFAAVEAQFPYAMAPDACARALSRAGVALILFNTPNAAFPGGERGIACRPDRVEEYRAGVAQALAYAKATGCPTLNTLAGVAPPGVAPAVWRATLIDNLRFAADACARAGVELVMEAINTRDVPGFCIATSADALAVIDAVGSADLKLQYDIYHMQRMEGEIAATLERHLPRIGHIQIADNPGRGEPGTGEINFPFLFAHLDRIGYRGWVGCEYAPTTDTRASLAWMARA